ncbi:hypothetical protein K474DRAFT_1206872 [Panus rudis PR-1116 ss-1]|nr:hypothetical protein K474DRAFT_1206872 [Panus rudis PR-1116 ss-1]
MQKAREMRRMLHCLLVKFESLADHNNEYRSDVVLSSDGALQSRWGSGRITDTCVYSLADPAFLALFSRSLKPTSDRAVGVQVSQNRTNWSTNLYGGFPSQHPRPPILCHASLSPSFTGPNPEIMAIQPSPLLEDASPIGSLPHGERRSLTGGYRRCSMKGRAVGS